MPKFMTIEDIAKELHITLGTARNRISKNELMPPSVRIGRRRLFPTVEFEKWVKDVACLDDTFTSPTINKSNVCGRPPIKRKGTRIKKEGPGK